MLIVTQGQELAVIALRRTFFVPVIILVHILTLSSYAIAQPGAPAPALEMWAGISVTPMGPSGVLITSYSPPLLFDGDFASRGGQTVHAETRTTTGFTAGMNVFPVSHVGLQLLLDRASWHVAGANPPYAVTLQYVSRQPPDDQGQLVQVARSTLWPDTSGSLTQLALALNLVARVAWRGRLSASVSGGPSVHRVSGTVQPLGYTTFRLGGHAVLFEDDARLAVSLSPAFALGVNVGGDITAAMTRHAAVVIGYRYLGGPSADMRIHPTTVLNADQLIFQQSLADIDARLGSHSMRLSVSGSRLIVAFKFLR